MKEDNEELDMILQLEALVLSARKNDSQNASLRFTYFPKANGPLGDGPQWQAMIELEDKALIDYGHTIKEAAYNLFLGLQNPSIYAIDENTN